MIEIPEKEYKVYSFDIFDTLLFRTVKSVRDIYHRTYDKYKDIFPDYLDAEEWSNLRVEIENKARGKNIKENNSSEIYLKDAYELLPPFIKEPYLIMEAEYNTEKEICFANKEIYEVLKNIKAHGNSRIILISDMYYTSKELKEILENGGIDLSLIDEIYVSCEAGCSKKYKKLYEYVLEHEKIAAKEMLHIGDNEYSDYSVPKQYGIDAVLYDVISHSEYNHSFLKIESLLYNCKATEIYALRNLTANIYSNKYSGEEQFWYQYGVMIFGPLCAGATEWVLDEAVKSGINRIFPLMREGQFLCRLLNEASKHREEHFDIRPLYISRKAVFLPSLTKPTEKDILYVFKSHGILVKDVFAIFGVEDLSDTYKEFAFKEVANAKKIIYKEHNLWAELFELFTSKAVLDRISENAKRERENLLLYLDSFDIKRPYITWDMGWRGYTQAALDKILSEENRFSKSLNLLIVGRGGSIENVVEGCNIKGYVGSFGKNWRITRELFSKIFELFFICNEGTTIGYQTLQNGVTPITRDIIYGDLEQIKKIQIMQEGVIDFQKEFLKLISAKPNVRRVIEHPDELCRIVARSLGAPTWEEMKNFGKLFYDQNFGADIQIPILPETKISNIRKNGMERCINEGIVDDTDWISGVYVAENPFYYYEQSYLKNQYILPYRRICFVKEILKECDDQQIVLVGGGRAAVDILQYLRMIKNNIKIEAVADNDEKKWNTFLYGIPIKDLNETFSSDIYVITSFDYANELTKQIYEKKGTSVKVISYDKQY